MYEASSAATGRRRDRRGTRGRGGEDFARTPTGLREHHQRDDSSDHGREKLLVV